MTVAQIVPLRRFPSDHQWFDYLVPSDLSVEIGQLVEVPFLRQQVTGIVWNITAGSDIKKLRNISKILRPEPVMTAWQRSICKTIVEESYVSLGHVLDSIIPNFPKRKTTVKSVDPTGTWPDIKPQLPMAGITWWYRERRQALAWIVWWLNQKSSTPKLVMVPTVEDGQELTALIRRSQPAVVFVHSLLNRSNYTAIYEGVRQGRIKHVIGTGRGLTLPYPTAPEVLIDQEEHQAHKQTKQQPRTDYRRILEIVQADVRATTPAPSIRWWYRHQLNAAPHNVGRRQLADLGQVKKAPWLTTEAETMVTSCLAEHKSLLLIAPQQGYASSLSCGDCHLTVDCEQCHQRLRMLRQENMITCRHCGQTQKLPATCPRCHSTRWTTHGWGLEYIAEQFKKIWPSVKLTIAGADVPEAEIYVATYSGYRQAGNILNLGGLLVISGDALLNYPDFSVAERAWQYLARLQAEAPTVPMMVQTFTPVSDFWQRWRHGDDRAWYQAELAVRHRHKLPPIADQWIIRYPGKQSASIIKEKISEISSMNLSAVSVVALPTTGKITTDRLLLTSTSHRLAQLLNARQLFPYPWQVDTSVASWLS